MYRRANKYEVYGEKFLTQLWKELKRDGKDMTNWLFFYKTVTKTDKYLHIVEVVFLWIVFTKVFFGI
jgi:hypothetical protein